MVDHRKNLVPRKAYVPSSWFIVLTVLLCIGGAGWIGWLLVDDDSSDASSAAPSPAVTSPAPTAAPTTVPTTSPGPTDSPEPTTPTPSAGNGVVRDVPVSVLNNSTVVGAARVFSAKVTEAGWTVGGVGNWTGSIVSNTVYYPPAFADQAALLAKDVGIDRVKPSIAPMRTDRLTIILSGPQ